MDNLEELVMGIICNAGAARSACMMAIKAAKEQDFEGAEKFMKAAHDASNEAHLVQTQLIEADEGEGKTPMSLILVHAQDHLMNSILCREMAAEFIDLYKTIHKK
ncbi:TPA: PTS lactose/cellobiose transporter subunit IIA [Vibrio parahaemolyticus]